ncbi:MAG: DUF3817 domain-containing protein [Candidatus Competibacterales bacterium]
MINFFRAVSVLEGLSFLCLLSLVYVFDHRAWVFPVGLGHGLLFLLYFGTSLAVSHVKGWSIPFWLLTLLCAVVPFAFIPLEFKLKVLAESDVGEPAID